MKICTSGYDNVRPADWDYVIDCHDGPPAKGDGRPWAVNVFWIPIAETEVWACSHIYGFVRLMERIAEEEVAARREFSILIHCAAGANRSPTLAQIWRLYEHLKKQRLRGQDRSVRLVQDKFHQLLYNTNEQLGHLPPLPVLISFLEVMQRQRTWCCEACAQDAGWRFYTPSLKGRFHAHALARGIKTFLVDIGILRTYQVRLPSKIGLTFICNRHELNLPWCGHWKEKDELPLNTSN